MFLDPYTSFIGALLKAWQSRERRTRVAIVVALFSVFAALVTVALSKSVVIEKNLAETIFAVLGTTYASGQLTLTAATGQPTTISPLVSSDAAAVRRSGWPDGLAAARAHP